MGSKGSSVKSFFALASLLESFRRSFVVRRWNIDLMIIHMEKFLVKSSLFHSTLITTSEEEKSVICLEVLDRYLSSTCSWTQIIIEMRVDRLKLVVRVSRKWMMMGLFSRRCRLKDFYVKTNIFRKSFVCYCFDFWTETHLSGEVSRNFVNRTQKMIKVSIFSSKWIYLYFCIKLGIIKNVEMHEFISFCVIF